MNETGKYTSIFTGFYSWNNFIFQYDLLSQSCIPIIKIKIADKIINLTYVQYFNLITKGLNDNFLLFMIYSYENPLNIQYIFRKDTIEIIKNILAKRNPKYMQTLRNSKCSKIQNNFSRKCFKTYKNYKQKKLKTFYYHQNRKISHLRRAIT